MLRREDVQAFLDRPWGLFEEQRFRRFRRLSLDERFALSETLRRSVLKLSSPEARAAARSADWQHHVRMKELLERASAARRP